MPRRGFYRSSDDVPPSTFQPGGITYGTLESAIGNDEKQKGGITPFWCRVGIVVGTAAAATAMVFAASSLARLPSQAAQQQPLSAAETVTTKEFAALTETSDAITGSNSHTIHKIDVFHGEHPSSPTALRPGEDLNKLVEEQHQPEITVGSSGNTKSAAGVSNSDKGELTFVALNDYTRRGDVVGVGYPWLDGRILVEPYRSTSLEVVDPVEGMDYLWSIVETHDVEASLGEYRGHAVEVHFEAAPEYKVVLHERSAMDDTLSRSVTSDVYCKYVRREIRSLFPEERDEMLDAMKVLWDVPLADGKKLYGHNYLDIWTIDQFHQVGASDLVCDHLHDGIGFGVTHSMVTLMFEMSLQMVNPKLSLPYWDFTIDAYLVDKEYGGDYSHLKDVSDLWTPEWFGSVDPEDFQVKDGRWGNLTVPVLPQEQRDYLGADVFGRMRSPWNVNDREYLSRGLGEMCGKTSTDFYDWPTCKTHWEMQAMYTSYYGYTWHSQYSPHGPTHIWIGGNFDCKEYIDMVESIVGDDEILHIAAFAFIERKGLFRDGLFKCNGFAHADMSAQDVMDDKMCGCLDVDLDKVEDYQAIYDLFASGYNFGEVSEEDKKKLASQFCNGVIGIGESSQSGSPLDPSFWSLHPTMERLLLFKRLTNTMTDISWPDEVGTWVGMDGIEYDVVISIEDDECMGHRGSDVFPYGILDQIMTPQFNFYGKVAPNTRTNRELVHLFDPNVNGLSYIYDNFNWDHCAETGYDMNDIFNMIDDHPSPPNMGDLSELQKVNGYGMFPKGSPREAYL